MICGMVTCSVVMRIVIIRLVTLRVTMPCRNLCQGYKVQMGNVVLVRGSGPWSLQPLISRFIIFFFPPIY